MDLSDRRVVQFREWAERRFGIGSGGYGESEDLLSVVMAAVDRALQVERPMDERLADMAVRTGEDPAFLDWLRRQG